ncbi:hypothetical protein BH20ACT10_BH20ACT10_05600 [soil metagenome]
MNAVGNIVGRVSRGAFGHEKGRTMNAAERMPGAGEVLIRDLEKVPSEAHSLMKGSER